MYYHFLKISFLLLTIFSMSVNAEAISKQDLPKNVFDYIYKKHPEAHNFTIEEKTHFGRSLYKVTFTANQKDNNGKVYQEKLVDLFEVSGHFYTNEVSVERHSFNIISDAANKSMQLRYPDYEILEIKGVTNPNGIGEEYEIDLLISGKLWNISIDNHGKLISEKEQTK